MVQLLRCFQLRAALTLATVAAFAACTASATSSSARVAAGRGKQQYRHKAAAQQQLRTHAIDDGDTKTIYELGDKDLEKEMSEMLAAQKEAMTSPEAQLKEQLAAFAWLEDQLLEKQEGLSEEAYRGKIAIAEKAVAKDTSPGVASMLADMRREMHSLAAPFYRKVLDEQLKEVREKQHTLLAQIEAQQAMNVSTNASTNATEVAPLRRKTEAEDSSSPSLLTLAIATVLIVAACTVTALLIGRFSGRSAPQSAGLTA